VLDVLDSLVDKSLVDLRHETDSRFRLLSAIREFALEELLAAGELDATRSAHYEWVLDMTSAAAAAFDSTAPDDNVPLRAYEDDLRAALVYAFETEDKPLSALQLAATAGQFWYALGRAREGYGWLDRAITSAPSGRDAVHGTAHYWAGVLADELRQIDSAVAHLELSLGIRRELGDEAAITRTMNSLGVVARSAGDLVQARALLTECLERKRAADDPRVGSTITNLAIVAVEEGHFGEALSLFEEALEADRRSGFQEPHPAVLVGMAYVRVRLGEPDRSIEPALSAARRFASLEDELAVAETFDVLSEAWQHRQPRAALVLLEASNGIHDAVDIPRTEKEETRLEILGKEIRSRLSTQEVASLVAEGRALNAMDAVAYAEAVAEPAQP
jgi:tetratricopeptide (TPR) repeat protein